MLKLPIKTKIKKLLPKEILLRKMNIKSSEKIIFNRDIKKIYIINELSHESLNIIEGIHVERIFVILVELKKINIDYKNIYLLDKTINKTLVFLLEHEGRYKLLIYYNKTKIEGDWKPLEDIKIDIKGIDLDDVFKNIIFDISDMKNLEGNTIEQNIEINSEIEKLKKQIDILEKKARKETQPKEKFKIVKEKRELEKKLESYFK